MELSVVVVTWNRRDAILRCLESFEQQRERPDEVVVLVNGSTDGTAAAVREQFPEVRLVESPANLGCPGGRNVGIEAASGRWVLVCDDDAVAPPDLVGETRRAVERWPEAVVLAGAARDPAHPAPETLQERPVATFTGACAVMRRDPFLALGGYPTDGLREGEERDFAIRAVDAGFEIVRVPGLWVQHDRSDGPEHRAQVIRGAMRQEIVTALRYLPAPVAAVRVVHQVAGVMRVARREHLLRPAAAGLRDAVRVARTDLRRRPVAWSTIRRYRRLREGV